MVAKGRSQTEGQLAVDVYQTESAIVIRAPIAGVKLDDITISATEDMIKIRGERMVREDVAEDKYFTQECYWGPFSRTIILPTAVDVENVNATYKDGILRVEIMKAKESHAKQIEITKE